ncbi:ABC transporter-like [Macleaya cordata]|uniref:ABC transporter-like n=1 Tax=Macleaya cordata TaxID=56857 RepID=A0A200R5R6_MACCD|nr:ABC transporter-like [Macleaya cordata]
MSRDGVNACWVPSFLLFISILSSFSRWQVQSQVMDAYSQTSNPALLPLVTEIIYSRLSNLTTVFVGEVSHNLDFCIKDQKADWDGAFNFTSDLDFLSSCIERTKGDITQRLCTAAEMKFYFSSFFESGSKSTNYLKPNKNCNLTMWNPGCEPGWACSVGPNQKVDLKNSQDIPTRTRDCESCCEGFFCPRGITCMIPCPLGAYCPLAKLNKTTGICDPYRYQLPPGHQNHTCGGADTWADIRSSSEVFCSAGSYCPSTTQKIPCSSGHYCRTGSTSEKKCFKLTSCNPNTANQNLRVYGVMLIAALSTLLLIIYNCSDQVLTTRERRHAKSREAAARSAKKTAQARERWKAARDIAKKHALGLQTELSRTFSRQKAVRQPEQMMILDQARTGPSDALLLPLPPGISSASQQSSAAAKTKEEPSNLTKMLRALEEDTESNEDFSLETGDKDHKKYMPKEKMHTHSQIFKYAYGKLEKEKALQQENKNLTFSGVIKMATDTEIRTRPVIEVAFKDLTLTLKGKHKHLMRCVTGKIMPGRVSAVMGPSGAGKTTFLNALAGKTTGCTMTGLILINGKTESIHAYKKIIGFVPQDDIVHGNLTVEENLQFSARCRLSADMPKPDKVLVVERVIESLGLQPVRDSLVGTVEKRGISGGQRKRVNVGLEMVMEPSLLILDEPTSGLDSSSSQLLLRALRREALEGVNICMVVHQPSYSLFKMFDDLILLAKGGLTVYHGPVKKVEEYFAGLGIVVPDRVNPPDHFIDILEGIVQQSTSIDMTQLPVRWMLHNGYPIPPDMQHNVAEVASSSKGPDAGNETDRAGAGDDEESFAGDLWQDVKCNVELQRDNIQHNFLKSKDLSNRRTPGVFRQYRYYLGRVGKQRLREARIQAVDFLILLLAGACLGTLAKVSDETFGAVGYTYTIIAVSLLCKIAALRSFSLDKLMYWRESASGMSSLAYFLSKDTVDHFNTLVKPVVYLSMFYFFNNPRSSFIDNYIVLVCLVYCVTGIAYAFAIFLEPGAAQLWSVLLPVVLTLISTQQRTGLVKVLANLCYPKWALEAFVISNAERYSGVWLITRCGSLKKTGYDIHDWNLCIAILILYGVVSRAVAYFCMVTFKKK